MVLQYAMSWAACLAPARRKRRRRWLTVGLGDVHIVATRVTIHTYINAYIPIYIDTYVHIHTHTYILTHLHTYIPRYMHTYTHTYVHT